MNTEYENIKGKIESNGEPESELPVIRTKDKEYTWIQLGNKIMTYEGFNIQIKIIDPSIETD